MKKLLLSIFTIAAFASLQAQPYMPMLDSAVNIWTYTGNVIPVLPHGDGGPPQVQSLNCSYGNFFGGALIHYTQQDTVIDSLNYKVIYEAVVPNVNPTCMFGFMREDTAQRKVYFKDHFGDPEELIYDFSMQVGDSISLNFFVGNGYFTNGWFKLDSIGTVTIFAGQRRAFYLHNPAVPFGPILTWIESVGFPGHESYTYGPNWGYGGLFMNCNYSWNQYVQILTCFDHTQKIYFDQCAHQFVYQNSCFYYQDSCTYYNVCGGIEEFLKEASFTCAPNPAANDISVSLEVFNPGTFTLSLRDITGKTVLRKIDLGELDRGTHRATLDLSGLSDGFYLVECRTKNAVMFRKLVHQQN